MAPRRPRAVASKQFEDDDDSLPKSSGRIGGLKTWFTNLHATTIATINHGLEVGIGITVGLGVVFVVGLILVAMVLCIIVLFEWISGSRLY